MIFSLKNLALFLLILKIISKAENIIYEVITNVKRATKHSQI